MADTKLYSSVPRDVVFMVWELAMHARGVHHFRVFPANEVAGNQILSIEPWATDPKALKDISTWNHRWNISHVDRSARTMYEQWLTETTNSGALWVAPFRLKRGHPARIAERAKVHAEQDLICITLTGKYINFDLLDEEANKAQLRGLRSIGLNWKQTHTGKSWVITPFKCLCAGRLHDGLKFCPPKLAQFLHLFPDLRHFHFILRICASDIDEPETHKRGRGNNIRGGLGKMEGVAAGRVVKAPAKVSAYQKIENTLNDLRGFAEKNGLGVWSDSERVFIEVNEEGLKQFVGHSHMLKVMDRLKKAYRAIESPQFTENEKLNFDKTEFHFLICRNSITRKK